MNHAFKFWGSKVLNRLEANQLVCNLRYQFASEKFAKLPSMALDELMGIAPMPKSSALTKNVIEPAEYDLTVIVPAYNEENSNNSGYIMCRKVFSYSSTSYNIKYGNRNSSYSNSRTFNTYSF